MTKTVKLSELITELTRLKKRINANPDVKLSSDEEGNSIGCIDFEFSFGYDKDENLLIIYPIDSEYN
ncbi:MAG: hypothetical protein WCT77_02885 [Bacteroidota bacterium]|jgi:hypothetical protein